MTEPADFTQAERMKMRRKFTATLATLVEMEAYWCPERHCLAFRSVSVTGRSSQWRLPPDAEWVGTYAAPCPFAASTFLKDLEDVLERLQVKRLTSLAV